MDQLQSGASIFRIKPLSQLAQTFLSLKGWAGWNTHTHPPWHSFLHILLLVSPGNAHNRKLNTQSKQREASAHLCWVLPGPHHLPLTAFTAWSPFQDPAPTSCRDAETLSAPKHTTIHGIKWEQPQTYPRKPGTKQVLKLLVPPAIVPTPSQITVWTARWLCTQPHKNVDKHTWSN